MTADRNLPPSTQYVRHILERNAPLQRGELIEQTGLPEPTVDRATARLLEADIISKDRDDDDDRRVVYRFED